jgi:hypothetical protein
VYTGPGRYDAVPEAHPMTQYSTGYNYPTTVKPEVVQMCEVIFFFGVFWPRIYIYIYIYIVIGIGVGVVCTR